MTDDVRLAAERLIETIESRLPKWRAWFPSEESGVEVPRAALLAMKDVAKDRFAELSTEEITAERLLADGWKTRGCDAFKNGGATLFDAPDHNAMNGWFLASPKAAMACNVSTMGHVRSLLRLAKEVR